MIFLNFFTFLSQTVSNFIQFIINSYISPLESLVLSITERQESLGIETGGGATSLFITMVQYLDEVNKLVTVLRESLIVSMQTLPDTFLVSTTNTIDELFRSISAAAPEKFSNFSNFVNLMITSIFSAIISLLGFISISIPHPHEEYFPLNLIPRIRISVMQLYPTVQTLGLAAPTSFLSRVISFVYNLPIIKQVCDFIIQIEVRLLVIVQDILSIIMIGVQRVLKLLTPFLSSITEGLYYIVQIVIALLVIQIYFIYFWIYMISRVFSLPSSCLGRVHC